MPGRRTPATPQSWRREGIFNLDFFHLRKWRMVFGPTFAIFSPFLLTVNHRAQFSAAAAFYFPSHVPRLHISTIWLATSRLSLNWRNTEERWVCIMVTISRIFPPNNCGQKVFIAVKIKNDFRACGISAIIRNFVIESLTSPAPGFRSRTLTLDTEWLAYVDAVWNEQRPIMRLY